MSLSDLVQTVTTTGGAGLQQVGFGTILLAGYHTHFAERTRTYESTDAMATDGFATSEPLYRMAQTVFAQSPRPDNVKIGRLANAHTQTIKWIPLVTTVGHVYSLTLASAGHLATVSYTVQNSDTVALIIAGMITAIQGADAFDAIITATSQGGNTFLRAVTAVGQTVEYSAWDRVNVRFEDVTADPGIAADLDAIELADDDWYGLALDTDAKAIQQPAAAWIEAKTKMFALRTSDWMARDSSSALDIGSILQGLAYARTVSYAPVENTGDYRDAAALGERFPHDPGAPPGAGGTWHGKTLRGSTPDKLTPTEKTNLRNKHYVVYITTATRNHTLDGKTASGEFADVTRFIDWNNIRMQERIALLELSQERVPYTDAGVSLVEGQVRAQLTDGVNAGGWSPDPAPTVNAIKVANANPNDKAARIYRGISWQATLAGAIHLSIINGTVLI